MTIAELEKFIRCYPPHFTVMVTTDGADANDVTFNNVMQTANMERGTVFLRLQKDSED
jgi:hypothetical protein